MVAVNFVIDPRISAGFDREQRELIALHRLLTPEGKSLAVASKSQQVRLVDALPTEPGERRFQQLTAETAASELSSHNKVVDQATSTVMATEYGAYDFAIEFYDEARPRIAFQESDDRFTIVRGAEADSRCTPPKSERLIVVSDIERKDDAGFHEA